MTQIDNLQSNQQLTSLVADLTRLLESFLETLQSESEALRKNNPEQLSATSNIKQSQLDSIAAMTGRLESDLKANQLTLSDLFALVLSSQLPQALQQDIQRLEHLSNHCQDLNQANGMAIQILSNINNHAINLLSGKEQPDVKLYGSSGVSTVSPNTKKSLGKA